ncbi:hypothetical protein, partial [Azohydromonas lata]|uniref:hypothetical protein n=1 Tax=Azohydromonas lata TaxID=45677 RepID=UPI001C3F2291
MRKNVVIPAKAGIHECRGIALRHTEAYQRASRQHRVWRAVGRRKTAVIPAKAGIHAHQGVGVKPVGTPRCA